MCVAVTSKAAKDGGLRSGALLLLLVAVQYSCADPCVDYIDIGHPQRSQNYTTQPEDRYRCDYYVVETPGQWYRFIQYTGGRIPEECVPLYKCGTVSPIWMNGTHPTEEGVEVKATACANQGLGPYCCDWSSPMSVRMCRTNDSEPFYVYQLPRPGGCSSSYCAGDKEPCREGAHWDEELDACIKTEDTTLDPTTIDDTTPSDSIGATPWQNDAVSTKTSAVLRSRQEHRDGGFVGKDHFSFAGLLVGVLAAGIVVGASGTVAFFHLVVNKRTAVKEGTRYLHTNEIQSCDAENITVSVPPLYTNDGILETKKGLGLDTQLENKCV